jgi:hypothetical protein
MNLCSKVFSVDQLMNGKNDIGVEKNEEDKTGQSTTEHYISWRVGVIDK